MGGQLLFRWRLTRPRRRRYACGAWSTAVSFHRLRTELQRTQAKFRHVSQNVVRAVRHSVKTIRNIDADLDAAKFGIRLGEQAHRHRGQRDSPEVSSSVDHKLRLSTPS